MRRVWAGLVLAAWVGATPAQPPTRPAAPQTETVLIQKSAGQPDRRLKLLKLDTGPDGERVADVQDVATGLRYTLPAAALAGMTRATAPVYPGPDPLVKPATTARSAVSAYPGPDPVVTTAAKPAGKFPTSLTVPEPSPGGYSAFTARPLPTAPAKPAPKWADPPQPMPAAALDTPLTALVAAPARPAEEPPIEMPTPAPAPAPVVAVAPPPVQQTRFQSTAIAQWQMTRAEQMRAEIEPYTHDLVNALRPSVRERAATTLANCRHASQPEVKQLLARTAVTDPAPTVQAHCVRILAGLGYHEREYVEFLEASLGSEHAGLRQAAATALAKLAPK